MTSSKDILEYEKGDFKESAKILKKQDVDWLLKRLVKQYPELEGYENDPDKEYSLLSQANLILYSINEDRPSDIRKYVEKKLKEEGYDKELGRLGKEIFSLRVGDEKAADEMREKLRQFVEKADREVPDFGTSRGKMISEMYGDILAIRTKGRVGSMRTVLWINEGQSKEKEKKRLSK